MRRGREGRFGRARFRLVWESAGGLAQSKTLARLSRAWHRRGVRQTAAIRWLPGAEVGIILARVESGM